VERKACEGCHAFEFAQHHSRVDHSATAMWHCDLYCPDAYNTGASTRRFLSSKRFCCICIGKIRILFGGVQCKVVQILLYADILLREFSFGLALCFCLLIRHPKCLHRI
jgi:hypothetical protein